MRKLEHQNIVKLMFFFYSSGDKVSSKVDVSFFIFFSTSCLITLFIKRAGLKL